MLHVRGTLMVLLQIAIFLAAAQNAGAAGQFVAKKEFPRLGGMQIGRSPWEGNLANSEYRAALGKLDFIVIHTPSRSLMDYAKDIKSHNPNIVIAKYQNPAETRLDDNFYDTPMREKLDSERGPNNTNAFDWWLRDANGNRLELWPNTYRTNLSEYVQPDANGDRWPQWRAKFEYDLFMKDPVWDGWFMDLHSWKPKWKGGPVGDFSGGKVSEAEHDRAYRRGNRAYWDEIRKLSPDSLILVNFNWFLFDESGDLDLGPYEGANGGYIEYYMDWEHNHRDWQMIYRWYRLSMGYFVEPKFVLFDVRGRPDDYQFFRYAFTTSLMADGYFEYSPNNEFQKGAVLWYDEFDLAGRANTKWMGQPVSVPPESAWQAGVYRRDFENAVALVNPVQNGRVTVTVENGLRKIAGNQDSAVNDGRPASSITLEAGDGIVLVRENSVVIDEKRPKPPRLFSD